MESLVDTSDGLRATSDPLAILEQHEIERLRAFLERKLPPAKPKDLHSSPDIAPVLLHGFEFNISDAARGDVPAHGVKRS